jgi:hypothetical protein
MQTPGMSLQTLPKVQLIKDFTNYLQFALLIFYENCNSRFLN